MRVLIPSRIQGRTRSPTLDEVLAKTLEPWLVLASLCLQLVRQVRFLQRRFPFGVDSRERRFQRAFTERSETIKAMSDEPRFRVVLRLTTLTSSSSLSGAPLAGCVRDHSGGVDEEKRMNPDRCWSRPHVVLCSSWESRRKIFASPCSLGARDRYRHEGVIRLDGLR